MNKQTENIIIYGSGMLGQFLYNYLMNKNETLKLSWNIRLYSIDEVDITKITDLKNTLAKDSIIINCAAYTNVDKAEIEQDLAYAVNADAVKNLAKLCKERNSKLIHISSDFVYGKDDSSMITESTCLDPINVYGASKAEGEESVRAILGTKNNLVLRVAWTFGINGNNFIRKIYEQLVDNNVQMLNVVDDQYGRPTSTELISYVIYLYISKRIGDGVYNLNCPGNIASKYDIAMHIKKYIGSNKQINKKFTKDFEKPGVAKHQKNSMLDCKKLYNILSLHTKLENWTWNSEVNKYINLLKENNKNE